MVEEAEEQMTGFRIRCGGEGVSEDLLVVSDEDAMKIVGKCEYFLHVFAHGTRESAERILVKPDWSLTTAKHTVELLTEGTTIIQDGHSFNAIKDACQQILLETVIQLPNSIPTGKTCRDRAIDPSILQEYFSLTGSKGPMCIVELRTTDMNCDDWLKLLERGILVGRNEKMFMEIALKQKAPRTRDSWADLIVTVNLGTVFHKYLVQARKNQYPSLDHLFIQMCNVLHDSMNQRSDSRVFHNEEFSLRVPCYFFFRVGDFGDRLSRSSGARIYYHKGSSLGYYLDGSNKGSPTITGTLTQIRDALNLIPLEMIESYDNRLSGGTKGEPKRCALRVCAPQPETLNRLLKAVTVCKKNPNTLGVNLGSKAFFAVKTVDDMKLLLDSFVASSSSSSSSSSGTTATASNVEPNLTLFSLGYPKGVF